MLPRAQFTVAEMSVGLYANVLNATWLYTDLHFMIPYIIVAALQSCNYTAVAVRLVYSFLLVNLLQLPVKEDVVERFEQFEIDGDLLLLLREEQLRDDLEMNNSIHRMR